MRVGKIFSIFPTTFILILRPGNARPSSAHFESPHLLLQVDNYSERSMTGNVVYSIISGEHGIPTAGFRVPEELARVATCVYAEVREAYVCHCSATQRRHRSKSTPLEVCSHPCLYSAVEGAFLGPKNSTMPIQQCVRGCTFGSKKLNNASTMR